MHQKHQNKTIKTTISQQYTSFVFPFAESRSVDVTSVDRENNTSYLSVLTKTRSQLVHVQVSTHFEKQQKKLQNGHLVECKLTPATRSPSSFNPMTLTFDRLI